MAYFSDYPVAPRAFWTVGIVGGLAAGVLLAAHSRRAGPAAVVSVVATVCLDVLTVGLVPYCRPLAEREILR